MGTDLLQGHLDLLLLSALSRGPCHGYAVAEALRARSGGVIRLAEGTLYPALHRLETQGALRSRWAVVAGRRRRVYALTSTGRRALAREAKGWDLFSSGVRAVLQQGS